MSGPLEATRAQLVTALDVVLPGRVFAHPVSSGRAVTPSIFIEQATISGELDEPLGTFPVWVIADGAVQAQVDAHDSIVWNALLAVYPYAQTVAARPMQVVGMRATVVEVTVLLDAFGLCGAPAPVAHIINGRELQHASK